MTKPLFTGVMTAIVTPFKESGDVDVDGLRAVIEDQLAQGVHGIVACGTTGEAATLTAEERVQVIKHTVEQCKGRAPVIAGAGHNSTRVACDLQKEVKALGADGSLQVTPWYNKPTQEGLYRHFRAVTEAAAMPTVLYNVPGRCSVDMSAETVIRLAKDDKHMVAVKEATGIIGRSQAILGGIAGHRDDFAVLSGEDTFILGLLAIGGHGVVSVISHLCGSDLVAMFDAFHAGKHDEAARLSAKITPLQPALFFRPNPVPTKAALAMGRLEGKMGPHVRLPLLELTAEEREDLAGRLQAAGYA
jgi:4-hydroxy-tetrahydrodipicolinate synthase